MKAPWLSVIIPIYNPPLELLRKSVESVQKITVPTEIILIDDGSNSGCGIEEFCTELHDDRIVYVYQENQGVSRARTNGLKKAKGEYVCFLDSDDEISEEWRKFLENKYLDISSDWVLFNVVDYYPKTKTYSPRPIFHHEHEMLNAETVLENMLSNANLNECWGKLIRRGFLEEKKIVFPQGIAQGEDKIFNHRILRAAKSIEAYNVVGYIYRYDLKNTQRLLKNPEKYFNDSKIVFTEELETVNLCTNGQKQKQELIKVKISRISVIASDIMKLMVARCWTGKEKKIVTEWTKDNQLFSSICLQDINSFKEKVYYILLKYQLWKLFELLSVFKSLQISKIRGQDEKVL